MRRSHELEQQQQQAPLASAVEHAAGAATSRRRTGVAELKAKLDGGLESPLSFASRLGRRTLGGPVIEMVRPITGRVSALTVCSAAPGLLNEGYPRRVPNVDVLLAAYDQQMRPAEAASLPPGVYAESDAPLVRIVGQHRGLISAPPDLHLGGPALDALINRQRDFFAARNEEVEWKTRDHDRPRNIGQRLAAAGFTPEEPRNLVIGLVEDVVRQNASLPGGVVVRRTTEEADMHRVAALESEVWGEDWDWLADDLIVWLRGGPDQIAVLVAEASGQVVAAGWLVCKPGTEFAGLWGGSTLAGWRGRGIYRALVAHRARLAMARGVRYLQVDASGNSRPILERLGFVTVTTTINYVWSPPS